MNESPMRILIGELSGLYGQQVLEDIGKTIRLYDFYDGRGQDWELPKGLDYRPTKKRVNLVKKLIKREAGFMFGRTPEITFRARCDADKQRAADMQCFFDEVLRGSGFKNKLIRAARDCFIGRRVAMKVSGGVGRPLRISFRPSFEFVYTTAEDDCDTLDKIIFFYQTNNEPERADQRVWKQKYFMREGRCFCREGIYDGFGHPLEDSGEVDTGLDFIPCYVIVNDGLTGDLRGESDVEELIDLQNAYNRLISDDADALRFNMFPQTVAVDAKVESLENIRLSPGALVDLQTDPAIAGDSQSRQAKLHKLEAGFGYSERFEAAINRTKNDMFDLLSVPNVGLEQLRGVMQSGKSMKALYWELITRCEDKWAAWEPALEWLARAVMAMRAAYADDGRGAEVPSDFRPEIHVEHLYPILEDDFDEMSNDRQEVERHVRSRSSYIEKWGIAPSPADELRRIDGEIV